MSAHFVIAWRLPYIIYVIPNRNTKNCSPASKWANKLFVESSWNVMAHGDAREGKWRGNWQMEWVASTLHTASEHGVSSITTADAHTSAADWTDAPADLNGPVRFAERRNLVSARVITFQSSLIHSFFLVLIEGSVSLQWLGYPLHKRGIVLRFQVGGWDFS